MLFNSVTKTEVKELKEFDIDKNNISYRGKTEVMYIVTCYPGSYWEPEEVSLKLEKINSFEVLEIEYPDGEMPDGEEFEQKKSEITEEDIIEYLESECGIEY